MWDRLHIVSNYQTIHASTPFFTAPSCAHITSHFLLPWMHGPYKLSIRNPCPIHFASILDSKLDNSTSPPTRLVLTQWLGQPSEDMTWEPWQELCDTYHLEDKVVFEDGGIVSNIPHQESSTEKPKRITTRLGYVPARLQDLIIASREQASTETTATNKNNK